MPRLTAPLLTLLVLGFAIQTMAETPRRAAQQVDRLLTVELIAAQDGKPAPRTDDQTFLKRVFLDTIGTLPTADDIVVFSLDQDPQKRAKVVEGLLKDEGYGRNWSAYWRDVVFYRRSEDRALIAANALTEYLTEQLNANTSWNKVASSFVTASGDVRENGATALIMAQGGRPEESVAEFSRIFMGIQIQCAQCHDHPTDRWKREQFHQLAAFFPRVAVRPKMADGQRSFMVVATDFEGRGRRGNNNNRYRGTLEHRMPNLEDPSEAGELMTPVFFVTGQKLSAGTRDAQRRGSLASWLTSEENPWFAKAYVNRMWSELVGEGFYEPVDDMGPDRDCAAPKTLDYLAEQFVASGHDPKWLLSTIIATEAYQRESQPRRNPDATPFLANCPQRMRADQLFSNLLSVLDIREQTAPSGRGGGYGRAGPRAAFSQIFGFDPSERRDEVTGSIPQALALMNSTFVNQAISARRRGGLGRMLAETRDDETLVGELYLKTLAREPSKSEVRTCLSYLRKVGDRDEAFEDILWALVNSTEFIHRR